MTTTTFFPREKVNNPQCLELHQFCELGMAALCAQLVVWGRVPYGTSDIHNNWNQYCTSDIMSGKPIAIEKGNILPEAMSSRWNCVGLR